MQFLFTFRKYYFNWKIFDKICFKLINYRHQQKNAIWKIYKKFLKISFAKAKKTTSIYLTTTKSWSKIFNCKSISLNHVMWCDLKWLFFEFWSFSMFFFLCFNHQKEIIIFFFFLLQFHSILFKAIFRFPQLFLNKFNSKLKIAPNCQSMERKKENSLNKISSNVHNKSNFS